MADAGESTTDRKEMIDRYTGDLAVAGSKNEVLGAIGNLLGVSAPVGSPSTLDAIAQRYNSQADNAADVQHRVEKVAASGLPSVWVGSTGAKAAEVVAAAGRSAEQMAEAFRKASRALYDLSDALTSAQSKDEDGREQLRKARTILGGEDGFFDDMVEKDAEEADAQAGPGHRGNGGQLPATPPRRRPMTRRGRRRGSSTSTRPRPVPGRCTPTTSPPPTASSSPTSAWPGARRSRTNSSPRATSNVPAVSWRR